MSQAHRRHDLILEQLELNGHVFVSGLSKQFGVSEMTIRRDLELLEQRGTLDRVHGGAVSARSMSYEPPFPGRAMRNLEAKQRIAQKAASLIKDGETVILDAGTTTLEIARALHGRRKLRVLALSLHIAEVLADDTNIALMTCGGTIRPVERSFTGALAEQIFSNFSFDTLFLTLGGIDLKAGVTEYNLDDASVKRAAFASARRCIAVADSTKLSKTAFARVCDCQQLDALITDADPATPVLEELRRLGVNVITV